MTRSLSIGQMAICLIYAGLLRNPCIPDWLYWEVVLHYGIFNAVITTLNNQDFTFLNNYTVA